MQKMSPEFAKFYNDFEGDAIAARQSETFGKEYPRVIEIHREIKAAGKQVRVIGEEYRAARDIGDNEEMSRLKELDLSIISHILDVLIPENNAVMDMAIKTEQRRASSSTYSVAQRHHKRRAKKLALAR